MAPPGRSVRRGASLRPTLLGPASEEGRHVVLVRAVLRRWRRLTRPSRLRDRGILAATLPGGDVELVLHDACVATERPAVGRGRDRTGSAPVARAALRLLAACRLAE